MGLRLKMKFEESNLRPTNACTMQGSKDKADDRRWNGRSEEAVGKKWISIRRDYTKFYGIKKRIEDLKLTGNFGEAEFTRMALVEFSHGEQRTGHLYDIGCNKEYHFDNKFEFFSPFRFQFGHTSLVCGSSLGEDEPAATNFVMDRPVGTKVAKKRKMEKKENEKRGRDTGEEKYS